MQDSQSNAQKPGIGTWQVAVSGVALVVAASTLVSDFTGYFTLGAGFTVALVLGFAINLLLGLSAADLAVSYPRAGALYNYARAIIGGRRGEVLAVFLGLSFFCMTAFAASGETSAGAFGLRALLGSSLDIKWFVVLLCIAGVLPNLFGIRSASWVSAGLLILMLGIRWFFGVAGFFGWGATESWTAANLVPTESAISWFGDGGILTVGLSLAIWSFVGIEFACSLAEETDQPRKSIPRGIILGMIGILATSLVMGIGVTGSLPLAEWQQIAGSSVASNGEAPQLAVGQVMFGRIGFMLMALASVSATLGTLTVVFSAMPRIIYSIARDGNFFGSLSKPFGKLNPKSNSPIAATLLSFILYLAPALYSATVIDWVYSAAYAWLLLYAGFHILVVMNRKLHPNSAVAFGTSWFPVAAVVGAILTLGALYVAFLGSHVYFGGRVLAVLCVTAIVSSISVALSRRDALRRRSLRLTTAPVVVRDTQ